jgi:hypothetical protein
MFIKSNIHPLKMQKKDNILEQGSPYINKSRASSIRYYTPKESLLTKIIVIIYREYIVKKNLFLYCIK